MDQTIQGKHEAKHYLEPHNRLSEKQGHMRQKKGKETTCLIHQEIKITPKVAQYILLSSGELINQTVALYPRICKPNYIHRHTIPGVTHNHKLQL